MKSSWITHRGQRVFRADYANLGIDMEALKVELNAVVATLSQEPLDSVVVLNDVHATTVAPGAITLLREAVTKTNPYVRKRAVIGLSGVRRGLLDVINAFTGRGKIRAFDTAEQALDWLVEE